LLVREDEEHGITKFVLVQHALQLLAGLNYTIAIVAVDDEDDTLGVLEVMSPEWADLVLSSDIPYGELDVLVLDGLDIEAYVMVYQYSAAVVIGIWLSLHTDCGDGGDDFTELQLVQNGGLSGSVQSYHEDAHLLLAP